MIKSAVTICLVPEARGGPFVFWDDLPGSIRKAQKPGFDAVEIFPPGPEALKVSDVKKLLGDQGLSLAAVGTGAGWVKHKLRLTDGNAAVRLKAREFVKSIIDFAGALGAPAIIGSMQGRHGDGVTREAALGYLTEAVQQLGSHARQYGVPLLYEPINRYETNLITSIVDGASWLRPLGDCNVLLLADLFHMNIEEVDLPAAIRAAKGFIGHVHFVDSNRRPAGLGHLDYAPIAAALLETGYDRYCSAEALPYPDSDQAAEQTIKTFRTYFSR
jgi:sugar phosphate isomerase/epimerase